MKLDDNTMGMLYPMIMANFCNPDDLLFETVSITSSYIGFINPSDRFLAMMTENFAPSCVWTDNVYLNLNAIHDPNALVSMLNEILLKSHIVGGVPEEIHEPADR